ncbi:unnamed protein product [Ambrosiozyma monospora]|uniref:Unnamed protein product n=1 Tax=Ambrosiozyma monospora TaxID=43982 RepID=A0ACB5T5Y2_AMBMO|nr:unnamed protein product [Ambrosiozyma monospora]
MEELSANNIEKFNFDSKLDGHDQDQGQVRYHNTTTQISMNQLKQGTQTPTTNQNTNGESTQSTNRLKLDRNGDGVDIDSDKASAADDIDRAVEDAGEPYGFVYDTGFQVLSDFQENDLIDGNDERKGETLRHRSRHIAEIERIGDADGIQEAEKRDKHEIHHEDGGESEIQSQQDPSNKSHEYQDPQNPEQYDTLDTLEPEYDIIAQEENPIVR